MVRRTPIVVRPLAKMQRYLVMEIVLASKNLSVFGVDGRTFNNRCEAECDKTQIKCQGKCPCEQPDPGFGQILCGDKESGVICSYPETCVKIKAPCGPTCTYLKPTCMCGDQECNLTCSDSEICVRSNFLCVKPPCCGANRCEP